jgi:hypothetical protein
MMYCMSRLASAHTASPSQIFSTWPPTTVEGDSNGERYRGADV